MDMVSRWRELPVIALIAACAAGRLHDQAVVGNRRVHEGMPAAELTSVMGPPDFVASAGHRFAWEFGRAGRGIEAGWDEWVWFREPKTYVVCLSAGTVRRVGVIIDTPLPPQE